MEIQFRTGDKKQRYKESPFLTYLFRSCSKVKQPGKEHTVMKYMPFERNILTVSASTKRVGHSEHVVNI